ncbi:MAG: HD domain-containing protein [Azoarcus sp.]|nr:HD domain-containing protein [Azoarcus sp.]
MFTEIDYSIFDFAVSLTEAVDLVSSDLNDHHKKVCYISYMIAKEMALTDNEIRDIALGAILHDIGAFTCEEKLKIISPSMAFHDDINNQHQYMGYKLLRDFQPFSKAATLIKYHHARFDKSANEIPIGSYIIHLADRISILLDKRREVLGQIPEIMNAIEKRKAIFHPDTLDALRQIMKVEYFWIEACSLPVTVILSERIRFPRQIVDVETIRSLAKLISQVIDFRSRFTATHSSGVAAVALELAKILEFSERECKFIEIAGYLHDIGKLAISDDILEKNGTLNVEEFNEMRKHTYYTYAVLSKIKGFEQVATWAAYHHERLDGNGYPFHVKGANFTKLSRLVAVADIVTAITEDRPYRRGMSAEKATEILSNMVTSGGIDEGIVAVVKENFQHINGVRIKAQQDAQQKYNAFYDSEQDCGERYLSR